MPWVADERGINAFVFLERDELLVVFYLDGIAEAPPLHGTNSSGIGVSGTCCAVGVIADGLCGGLEGGESLITSIDANGLSEASMGSTPCGLLVQVCKAVGS